MQRFSVVVLFVLGIPGMVDDYQTWTSLLGINLPQGVGTALVVIAIGWGVILACYQAKEHWVVHMPLIGQLLALKRFKKCEATLREFSQTDNIEYVRIKELMLRLRKIDIEYPDAGIDPRLRRLVTNEMLAACKVGDVKAARSAWRNTQDKWTGTNRVEK